MELIYYGKKEFSTGEKRSLCTIYSTFPRSPLDNSVSEQPRECCSIRQLSYGSRNDFVLVKLNFALNYINHKKENIILDQIILAGRHQNPQSDRLIHFAAEKLQEQGKAVWIAQPKTKGWDYNDVLKHQGLAAVKQELQQALSYSDYQDQIKPGFILPKELSGDVEKKSPSDRELGVDKNPVNHPKIQSEKQPELEI